MITVPRAEGVSVNHLMGQAAQAEGIDLPDPHAELGTTHRLRELGGTVGLEAEDIQRIVWEDPEPLDDPAEIWQRGLNYGFAEPLKAADPEDAARLLPVLRGGTSTAGAGFTLRARSGRQWGVEAATVGT